MSKAEDLSKQYREFREQCGIKDPVMLDEIEEAYFGGYCQAEKDLELGWEDIREIYIILLNVQGESDDDYLLTLSIPDRIENEHREYKEILKRYFEWKNNEVLQQRIKKEAR